MSKPVGPLVRSTGPGAPHGLRGLIVDWGGVLTEEGMTGLVRRARQAGVKTGLLSNSGLPRDPGGGGAAEEPEKLEEPEDRWPGLFDTVVISGRVGMRKPDPEIFLHTARRLGLAPQECVFVDDLRSNIDGAVATGMVGVLFATSEDAAGELEILFGLDLGG